MRCANCQQKLEGYKTSNGPCVLPCQCESTGLLEAALAEADAYKKADGRERRSVARAENVLLKGAYLRHKNYRKNGDACTGKNAYTWHHAGPQPRRRVTDARFITLLNDWNERTGQARLLTKYDN